MTRLCLGATISLSRPARNAINHRNEEKLGQAPSIMEFLLMIFNLCFLKNFVRAKNVPFY